LHVLRRNDLEFNGGELIWLEEIFPRFKILVCTVYRSPGAVNNFWENFHISIERAFESSPRIIITGDLNVNLLIENDHRLNQIINIFNLTNCIREPTRLGALLDPILFSNELETTFSDVIQVELKVIMMPQLPFSQSPMTFRLIIKEMYGCINMEIMMVLILKLTNLTGKAVYHH
jgi:hypothetical protein